MDKKLYVTFAMEGDLVDKIDIYKVLTRLDAGQITHLESKLYYTEAKPKKEEKK